MRVKGIIIYVRVEGTGVTCQLQAMARRLNGRCTAIITRIRQGNRESRIRGRVNPKPLRIKDYRITGLSKEIT